MNTRALLPLLLLNAAVPSFADEPKAPTLALGAKAPDFDLPGVDGRNHALAEYASSPVLVVLFTCNHCPTAQYYEERIKQIAADYGPKGVALVAISPNDPESVRPDEMGWTDLGDSLEEMKIRARDRGFNFPYLFAGAEAEAVSLAYGPVATPHAFVFDRERKLRYVGRIDDAERERFVRRRDLREALDALLAGREVSAPASTKSFGCSVKWSDKKAGTNEYWAKLAKEPVTVELADASALQQLRINRTKEGKFRLVNFWATWCGPCLTEFPELMAMHRMYRLRDFEVVTVAANYPDEKDDVLKWLQKNQAVTKNLVFADTDKYGLMEAFEPSWTGAVPFTVLIDPAGEVVYKKEGSIDALELKRTIVKTLNARKPW
ncbi:MAG TPA: redoxin domain-containing protein [Vicinamibacteria bacterium]|nr:redoxin domain-containing protein [Vicinamibacteria bacterium]